MIKMKEEKAGVKHEEGRKGVKEKKRKSERRKENKVKMR